MKRLLCLILCLILLLSGCSIPGLDEGDTTFYYCRTDFTSEEMYSVIAPESREVSSSTSDLKNLLTLYLLGPLDEELTSPFEGTKLISVEENKENLIIHLSDNSSSTTDVRFSLACACMTMTCLDLTAAQQVTILCGERSATMSQDNLLLHDNITHTEPTTEEPQ